MAWVNTVIAAAGRQGVAAESLLAAAGLPPRALERERWPIDYITRLWRAAERVSGDPGFGLKVGAGIRPAGVSGVAFVLQSAGPCARCSPWCRPDSSRDIFHARR